MSSQFMLLVGGVFNIAFFVFHAFFWRLFDWNRELASLTHINRQVMQILNLCLMFAFALFAFVSLFHADELLQTPLGRSPLLLISVFWWLRKIEQIVFFGLTKPISIIFFVVFVCGGLIYALPWYTASDR